MNERCSDSGCFNVLKQEQSFVKQAEYGMAIGWVLSRFREP